MSENTRYRNLSQEKQKRKLNPIIVRKSFSKIPKKISSLNNLSSRLSNTLNEKGYTAINHHGMVNRNQILNSYDQEILKESWIQLCNYIHRNYETGKGTYIKGFGTFTFMDPEISSEGMTNQIERDIKIKLRKPVFIVSEEFSDLIQPGIFNDKDGLIPYIQKKYKSVNIKKINYNEISLSLNISRDECFQIIKNIFLDMSEQIKKKKFISRELPQIGIILLKDNILGVKFNDDLINEICERPEKLILQKKLTSSNTELTKLNNSMDNFNNTAEKIAKKIIPKVSPLTHVTKEAENWLEEKMGIKPNEYDNKEESKQTYNKVENNNPNNLWNSQTFFAAPSHRSFIIKNKKGNLLKIRNPYVKKLSTEIQKAILANKGQILRELKNYDRKLSGDIARFEVVRAFDKSNIHPKLTMNIINDLINSYVNDQDFIEYNKLLTLIIKDIKYNLKCMSFMENENEFFLNTFNTKFKFGPKNKNSIFDKKNKININKPNFPFIKNISDNKINTINEEEKQEAEEEKENNNVFNFDEYNNLKIKISDVENEILGIKLILDDIIIHKTKFKNSLKFEKFLNNDEELNYNDFLLILKLYSITYPVDKILKILKFIGIVDPLKMNLNLLNKKFSECKVSSSEMTNDEINLAMNSVLLDNKLDLKNILFSKSQEITKNDFIYLLHDKTRNSDNILLSIFEKITNKKDVLSYDTLLNFINNLKKELNRDYNDEFYISSCNRILSKIKTLKISVNDYFSKLLRYNYFRDKNSLNKIDFVLSLQQEEYDPPFTEQQLNFIFDKMKNNKQSELDRNTFKKAIIREYNALNKIQDDIKRLQLTLDDIMFRMEFTNNDFSKNMNFWEFKNKIKIIDSYYSNDFLESLYLELVGDVEKNINIKYLLDSLNVFQKSEFRKINNDSFVANFINNIQNKVDYHTLKSALEKEDQQFSGKLTKDLFCSVIQKYTQDFFESDIIRFIRLTKLAETPTREVEYLKFINMVYYNQNLDAFLLAVNEINEIFIKEANKNLQQLISIINGTKIDKDNSNNYITIDQLYKYISEKIKIKMENTYIKVSEPITKNLICKFDIDCDGKISLEDLKCILQRYANTDYFKYENNSTSFNVNLFPNELLLDKDFKSIVKRIKEHLNKKRISEVGLFKLLDENKDGYINISEFNKNIDKIIELNNSMKDKFFNYLDGYKNGMIDLNTFLARFKEFKLDNMIQNDTNIENIILNNLAEYCLKNLEKLTDSELFVLMDKDRDGIISLNDFNNFCINELGIFQSQINDFKLQRTMQRISLSKNLNITLADIHEFIIKIKTNQKPNSYFIDLKEVFKESTKMNLSKNKKDKIWIVQLIEQLGLYINKKFESVENFYNSYANLVDNKLRFEDFNKFLEKNSECFQGFNITKDEIESLFTSLDSQKKNYLTLDDLKNKLDIFDFYKKMHFDIKNFLNNNFKDHIDAFDFFIPPQTSYESDIDIYKIPKNDLTEEDIEKMKIKKINLKAITKKQFYDGINYMFPGKYTNENLLTYINIYFHLNKDGENSKDKEIITFSQFSFTYYEVICSDDDFMKNKNRINKLLDNRNSIIKGLQKKYDRMHKNYSSESIRPRQNLFKIGYENLITNITPIDKSPLIKIKRLISNSPDINLRLSLKDFMDKFKQQNYNCNEHQFKNIIRQLNIGLSNIEIDEIIKRSGRTYNGMINIKDFYKYVVERDKNKIKIENSISITLSEFKQLLYKYYSNPKLAFIFHDKEQKNKMEFNKFKGIIIGLYTKEQKPIPNYVVLKSCFEYIDLRKDGVIDLVEWCNVFSKISGKLDLFKGLDNKKEFRELKKWEMSDNIIDIYKNIYKNRKIIALRAKNICFGSVIQEDSLINILKENFPNYKLTNTQWKIIVEIGTKNSKGFINFEQFMNIVESYIKR